MRIAGLLKPSTAGNGGRSLQLAAAKSRTSNARESGAAISSPPEVVVLGVERLNGWDRKDGRDARPTLLAGLRLF